LFLPRVETRGYHYFSPTDYIYISIL